MARAIVVIYTLATLLGVVALGWTTAAPCSAPAVVLVDTALGLFVLGGLVCLVWPPGGRHRGRFPYARP